LACRTLEAAGPPFPVAIPPRPDDSSLNASLRNRVLTRPRRMDGVDPDSVRRQLDESKEGGANSNI